MSQEKQVRTVNGWTMLGVEILIFCGAAALLWLFVRSAIEAEHAKAIPNFWLLAASVLTFALALSCAAAISRFSRTKGGC